jgi:hypothetical protein
MPPVVPFHNWFLKIELAAPPNWSYAAGDTIIGNIVRHAPVVAPEATLTIAFRGRVKVKITKKTGNSESVYRDRWHLFDQQDLIYKGPIHIAAASKEPRSWPISIPIPLEPVPSVRKGHSEEISFLPLTKDHPAHHVLPGSFRTDADWQPGGSADAYVEYWIHAKLQYQSQGHDHSFESFCPVRIRHPPPPFDPRYESKTLWLQRRFQTPRLAPGRADTELSLTERSMKFFGSSKVPVFFFKVFLTLPLVVQLNEPQPLQITLQVLPVDHISSDCLKDITQKVHLNWIKFKILSTADVIAPNPGGFRSNKRAHICRRTLRMGTISPSENENELLVLSTGKESAPVHIGNILQLTLHDTGLKVGNDEASGMLPIAPDFTTYGIKHSNKQDWELSLTIAGETVEAQFSEALQIISAP